VLERLSSMRESRLAVTPRKATSNVNSRDFETQPRIEWGLASSLMWPPGYPTAAWVSGEHSWPARIPRSPSYGSPTKNLWLALALASSSSFCLLMEEESLPLERMRRYRTLSSPSWSGTCSRWSIHHFSGRDLELELLQGTYAR
jgi:hypothetical protein